MYFVINLIGVLVFLAVGVLLSKKRKDIHWRGVGSLLALNVFIAWFLTSFPIGRDIVQGAAAGFTWLVSVAYEGIAFAFPDWVHVPQMNFFTSALLPILLVVPLFDILTYIGLLPFIIKWIGKALAFLTHEPKFESFFAIEMMFLGNTEALAVSSLQLKRMKADRCLTLAMMSMSCVTAALIGVYTKMMPAEFILTAVPLNVINALIVTNLLHPVKITEEEDTVARLDDGGKEREPFFSFLGNSILGAWQAGADYLRERHRVCRTREAHRYAARADPSGHHAREHPRLHHVPVCLAARPRFDGSLRDGPVHGHEARHE